MKNQEVPFAHIWRAPLCNFLIKSVHHHPKTLILPQCSYGTCFSSRIKVKEEEEAYFLLSFFFFCEDPNSLFLACVSMVMVPRIVWQCSKFRAGNYQEGSVASLCDSQLSIIYHQQEPFLFILFIFFVKMVLPWMNQSFQGGTAAHLAIHQDRINKHK